MLAVVRDPVDLDLAAPDHEVDVHDALVDPRLLRGIVDRVVVGAAERDVAGGVLVEQRVVEDAPEGPDSPLPVDESDLAQP